MSARLAPTDPQARFAPRFDDWRKETRRLLRAGVPPEAVDWQSGEAGVQTSLLPAMTTAGTQTSLLPAPTAAGEAESGPTQGGAKRRRTPSRGDVRGATRRGLGRDNDTRTALSPTATDRERPPTTARARVPRRFIEQARGAACHRDPERWALLYRLLWRLSHGERELLGDELDPDVARLREMVKQVRRDCHKMKAFVRFRKVAGEPGDGRDDAGEGGELYVAWHRPDHYIVERVAPFFVERFGVMRWAILTPDASAYWDGERLEFGPGAPRSAAPESDRLEDLWRTYYAAMFNPARLKIKAMKAELPVRHWATLPEAELIPGLIQEAGRRTREMVAAPSRPPARAFFPEERTLDALAGAVGACVACPLAERATGAVFGEGPRDARLMLVGEQPGDLEDREGRPFVGPAGRLLDRALDDAGLDRDQLYLTNVVKHFKWRPAERGKRRIHQTPDLTEVSACLPWVEAELAAVRPERVVCLGATAARALIGPEVRIKRDRGRVFEGLRAPWALPTYHPAAILRIPDAPSREAVYEAFVADLARAAA